MSQHYSHSVFLSSYGTSALGWIVGVLIGNVLGLVEPNPETLIVSTVTIGAGVGAIIGIITGLAFVWLFRYSSLAEGQAE